MGNSLFVCSANSANSRPLYQTTCHGCKRSCLRNKQIAINLLRNKWFIMQRISNQIFWGFEVNKIFGFDSCPSYLFFHAGWNSSRYASLEPCNCMLRHYHLVDIDKTVGNIKNNALVELEVWCWQLSIQLKCRPAVVSYCDNASFCWCHQIPCLDAYQCNFNMITRWIDKFDSDEPFYHDVCLLSSLLSKLNSDGTNEAWYW